MLESVGVQKNTAYGLFFEAKLARQKRQYLDIVDKLIHEEEVHKQCLVLWSKVPEQERVMFQKIADWSNAQQVALGGHASVFDLWFSGLHPG